MRLIDADKLERRIRKYAMDCYEANDTVSAQVFEDVVAEIQDTTTAHTEKHGKWIFDHMTGEVAHYAYCSCCGKLRWWKDIAEYFAYCPDCGTKMDLGSASCV